MDAQGFVAAAAEAAITPPIGTPLVGPTQAATGVHDALFARALVLGDGARRVAIVCLDLVGLDFALADEIRAAVDSKKNTPASSLLGPVSERSPGRRDARGNRGKSPVSIIS